MTPTLQRRALPSGELHGTAAVVSGVRYLQAPR